MPVPDTSLQVHPAAELFPLMSEEEYAALVADIREHGQREPITLYEGKILDGRNRWQACREIGIDPRTRQWDGKGSPAAFVISLNLQRRHLSASQRATIAADALPLFEAEAEARRQELGRVAAERQHHPERVPERFPEPFIKGEAREQAATIAQVNPRYVSDAKRVKEADPNLYTEVRNGTKTLPKAKQEIEARSAGERYPEVRLPGIPQDAALTIAKNLDRLPEQEREEKRAALRRFDVHVAAELAEKPPMPREAPPPDVGEGWGRTFYRVGRIIYSVRQDGGFAIIAGDWSDETRAAVRKELREWIETFQEWEAVLSAEVSDVA